MSNERFELGYWNIRGLASAIRYSFIYFQQPFVDTRYAIQKIGEQYDRSQWLNAKENLGLDFPNLPYLFDNETGLKLTQSLAILKYIWEVLSGKPLAPTPIERARLNLIEQELADATKRLTGISYNSEFEKLKISFLEALPKFLEKLEAFLGNNSFFGGEEITYVDFLAYEYIDVHNILSSETLSKFPKLMAFHARIEAIDSIAAYLKSDQYIKHPINNIMAKFL